MPEKTKIVFTVSQFLFVLYNKELFVQTKPNLLARWWPIFCVMGPKHLLVLLVLNMLVDTLGISTGECHSHTLGFFVAFANSQQILIDQLCLDAHFARICARSARPTSQRVSKSVPLSILYLSITIYMVFLKVWTKHNFYYIVIYISVYSA